MQIENKQLGKMKKLLLLAFMLVSTLFLFGQDIANARAIDFELSSNCIVLYKQRKPVRQKNLYFELAGSGGFGSINFEWNFLSKGKFRWMLRTGLSGTYIDKNNGVGFVFPLMVHAVYGKNHGLDVGIGQALTITTRGSLFLRTPLSIGYRLEPQGKRIFYRFSYTPIVSYLVDFQWEHWGGITIGYKLRSNPRYI